MVTLVSGQPLASKWWWIGAILKIFLPWRNFLEAICSALEPASATNTTTGLYISGQNNGFRIVVPAGTTTNTLRVYVGAWHAQGRMVAHLSDGSAADYVDTSLNTSTVYGTAVGVYTLSYHAATNGQTLTLTFTQDTAAGNVTLQAASLQ